MQRIDGAYLYELGAQIRPLEHVTQSNRSYGNVYMFIYNAQQALRTCLYQSIFKHSLRAVQAPGAQLLSMLEAMIDKAQHQSWNGQYEAYEVSNLEVAFRRLESVLMAELQTSALYLAIPKGGFDIAALIESGEQCFPSDLQAKVPRALHEVREAAKCIAFELPTAAGFHLHRANEAVLRVYYDAVTNGAARPKTRNMGDYLKKMDAMEVGDPCVKENLKALKNLHRNPLFHPDHIIQSIDEALNLFAAIRASIGYMLKDIPEAQFDFDPALNPFAELANEIMPDQELPDLRDSLHQ